VEQLESLENEIAEWRSFVRRGPAVGSRDVEELEAHLRDLIAELSAAGLAPDEAFLVAVKRMGKVDELSQEFAREHSGRLWRQMVMPGGDEQQEASGRWVEALLFAVAAGVSTRMVLLAGGFPDDEPSWFVRNLSLLVLPFLAGYFVRRRHLGLRPALLTALPFAVAAIVVNVYPWDSSSSTEALVAAHLPVVLWLTVAFPYTGGEWRSHERRMDFVRFTGEWFIYYVLIALGGGVLMALTGLILDPAGVDVDRVFEWVIPTGAAGAVVVAAWLVESKQRVVENMAPVLTALFTPLFAVMLVASVVVYATTGFGDAFNRELLGVFDALMVVVLGLVLYGISARDPGQAPGWAERIQMAALVSALLLDLMVLASMAARVGDLGFSPNRAAALGLNLVLLVNLAGTAWLSARFLSGHSTFLRLERWQTTYLPVFAAWAALVALALPPAFGFE